LFVEKRLQSTHSIVVFEEAKNTLENLGESVEAIQSIYQGLKGAIDVEA
jgi:hypothetical protein